MDAPYWTYAYPNAPPLQVDVMRLVAAVAARFGELPVARLSDPRLTSLLVLPACCAHARVRGLALGTWCTLLTRDGRDAAAVRACTRASTPWCPLPLFPPPHPLFPPPHPRRA